MVQTVQRMTICIVLTAQVLLLSSNSAWVRSLRSMDYVFTLIARSVLPHRLYLVQVTNVRVFTFTLNTLNCKHC